MDAASRITSKGQTTIPAQVREFLKLKPGDMVDYKFGEGCVVIEKKRSALELARVLYDPDRKPLTIEEMKAWPQAATERLDLADDKLASDDRN